MLNELQKVRCTLLDGYSVTLFQHESHNHEIAGPTHYLNSCFASDRCHTGHTRQVPVARRYVCDAGWRCHDIRAGSRSSARRKCMPRIARRPVSRLPRLLQQYRGRHDALTNS